MTDASWMVNEMKSPSACALLVKLKVSSFSKLKKFLFYFSYAVRPTITFVQKIERIELAKRGTTLLSSELRRPMLYIVVHTVDGGNIA